jgi:hypothetical protein
MGNKWKPLLDAWDGEKTRLKVGRPLLELKVGRVS